MKKSYLLELLLLLLIPAITVAQKLNDSITIHRHQFAVSKKDNNARLYLYLKLSTDYRQNNYDSSIFYGRKGLNLAKQMGFKAGEIQGLIAIEFGIRETGNLAEALSIQLQAVDAARELKNAFLESVELNSIGNTYLEMGDPKTGLEYYRKSSAIFKSMKSITQVEGWGVSGSSEYWIRNEASNIGNAFEMLNRLDSALSYETAMYHDKQFPPDLMPELLCRLGNVYVKLRKDKEAMQLYQRGAALSFPVNTVNDRATIYYQMAVLYNKWNRPDSSLYYAQKSFRTALTISLSKVVLNASLLIADLYGKNARADSAYYYQRIATKYKDALFGIEKFRRIQLVLSQEQQRQQRLLQEREELKNRYRVIGAVAALIFVLIILLLVWRNNRQSKKAYTLLQKQNGEIETQRKQALIEAALERVRSKTMAMRNSHDVANTVVAMFDELIKLGIEKTVRSGIAIIKDIDYMELWTASSNPNEEVVLTIGHLNTTIHPLLQNFYNAWKNKEPRFSYELAGNDVKDYYLALNQSPDYPVQIDIESLPSKLFHNTFIFDEGAIFVFSPEQLTAGDIQIYKRFTGVFGLTYRRFLDLQKAEAQAREAQIEAGLERVRSRTLAMQKSDELAQTAVVVFKELIGLGIQPNRLYIAIIKNETGDAEFWITDEDGSKVSSAFETNMNDNGSFKKMHEGWKEKKRSLMIDMKGKELENYFHHLNNLNVPFKDGLIKKRRVQYIAYFNAGFIGMASPDEQPEATVFLLERFAAVFNLTFTRFNDLKIAEMNAIRAKEDLVKLQTEKKKAEDTLKELQAAQTQLIQSEKMASLGELTAGIAHEIQNPLNFVNNFSEVNTELIDEMQQEIDKGDYVEVKVISNNIRENQQKISQHGKRADFIVKGMLQHSRTSTGERTLTNINVLADEFLRLSYHGLRAKDKSFNAELVTNFDESLPKINIVQQDIGRVLLNLFNNAFYAVNQKQKTAGEDYKPEISVTTSTDSGNIVIKVKDNGNGIPDAIKDKIMQPFFTTKPTGEGTGLGLSLSYDIVVKGHGGKIDLNSSEGKGSEFVISIPVNN